MATTADGLPRSPHQTMPQLHAFLPSLSNSKPFIHHNILWSSSSSSSSAPTRRRLPRSSPTKPPNLKSLTSRIVQLTRRRQLHQILEEIENAKIEYGNLNTIVMNVVMEACVHCGDVDLAMEACVHCGDVDLAINIFHQLTQPHSCGVDTVTYATLLEGLGRARRIDDAFQLLESVEKGTAAGKPKLSTQLIYGLLDALQVALQENGFSTIILSIFLSKTKERTARVSSSLCSSMISESILCSQQNYL